MDFRLPNITGATPQEQMAQMQSYMRYFVEQLQWALNNINIAQPSESNTTQPKETKSVTAAFPYDPATSFAALKPLIIKSSEIINAYYDKISTRLEGAFVAASEFGTFQEKTAQDVLSTSKATTQVFTNIQEIKTGLNAEIKTISDKVGKLDADIISYNDDIDKSLRDVREGIDNILESIAEVNATIKTGLLYYDESGLPVYGLELGQTNTVDGIEVFNKFARFTADRLTFYDHNEKEVAYISDRKLYINNVEVTAVFKMGGFIESVLPDDGSIVKRWVGRGGER